MIAYNVEPAECDLVFTKGDTIDFSFDVELNDVAYDMTGMQLDLHVKDCHGNLLRTFTSSGGSPEITILVANYTVLASPNTKTGKFKYDLQVTDGTHIATIQKGNWNVQGEVTT